jgi:hypothetical protein
MMGPLVLRPHEDGRVLRNPCTPVIGSNQHMLAAAVDAFASAPSPVLFVRVVIEHRGKAAHTTHHLYSLTHTSRTLIPPRLIKIGDTDRHQCDLPLCSQDMAEAADGFVIGAKEGLHAVFVHAEHPVSLKARTTVHASIWRM